MEGFDPFCDVKGREGDVQYSSPKCALFCGGISSTKSRCLECFYETVLGVNWVE